MTTLDLSVIALAPGQLPFRLEHLPPPVYFVGGTVRDALLQRQRPDFDVDCVVPRDAIATARSLADAYEAGFVVLDAERQIARVVFPNGTVDIAQMVGDSLETDLQRRDFRINAIAYDPHAQELFDPLDGIADLEAGVIRMVAKANLRDDPLRILRAYRQAAQLNFTIKPKTRAALRKYAPQLTTVAGERVQAELNILLSTAHGADGIEAADHDGVLHLWLPMITPAAIAHLRQVEQVAWLLGKIWDEFSTELTASVTPTALSRLSLAKLACLLAPAPEAIAPTLAALKYSRLETRAVETALRHLPPLLGLADQEMSLAEQYFLFQSVGDVFPIAVVLAVAIASSQDILRETRAVGIIAPLVNAYLDPNSQVAHPTPLVSGTDLIKHLSLSPSPQVGTLLTQIQLARLEGTVTTAQEAIAFAKAQLPSL
ncbi:CCA tRNA nucleotidyltransferase [Spirulina major]|uniref:CCA tRNA nucleotidyltransferase n=1 Tax=Spirulina major TaxID=270636 RepID=UPI000933ECB4|nr:CCA tRNA nucleotidyltransferase [Spirulina major]